MGHTQLSLSRPSPRGTLGPGGETERDTEPRGDRCSNKGSTGPAGTQRGQREALEGEEVALTSAMVLRKGFPET